MRAAISAYIAANPYDAGNYQQSIGVQRWIALYMQGIQGVECMASGSTSPGCLKCRSMVRWLVLIRSRYGARIPTTSRHSTLKATKEQSMSKEAIRLPRRLWWDVE